MLKALIIEDDKFLAASLKAAISEKFDADVCYDGLDGIKLVRRVSEEGFRIVKLCCKSRTSVRENTVLVGSPDVGKPISNLPPWLSILRDRFKEVLSWKQFQLD